MRKTIQHSICVFLLAFIIIDTAHGQTQVIQIDDVKPEIVGDTIIRLRLEKDWKKRNPKIQNEPVVWYELNEGFYGTYSTSNQNYMALYGLDGNYILTMVKTQWNHKIPFPLKSSFDLSKYKMHEVTSYWEVSGSAKKCSYLELRDAEGKVSHVWANEKGDFSTRPPLGKSKY